jgi:hypothetical protein
MATFHTIAFFMGLLYTPLLVVEVVIALGYKTTLVTLRKFLQWNEDPQNIWWTPVVPLLEWVILLFLAVGACYLVCLLLILVTDVFTWCRQQINYRRG